MACIPSLRLIKDFEWSNLLLEPSDQPGVNLKRELVLRKKLDDAGREVLLGLLPRAKKTISYLDIGYKVKNFIYKGVMISNLGINVMAC